MNRERSHLKEGDKAPDIASIDQDGNLISLKNFRGKKVVLYFYPKDNTPGCTAESCNLRDNYRDLKNKGYEILGVSCDDEKSHRKFIEKYKLPFALVSDTDKKVVKDYGVWGRKKFMGREFDGIRRTTFIIDEKGVIEKIIHEVDTADHSRQVLSDKRV